LVEQSMISGSMLPRSEALLFAIPALIALAFHPSLPKVSLAGADNRQRRPSNSAGY
jgi:hypothetical protein